MTTAVRAQLTRARLAWAGTALALSALVAGAVLALLLAGDLRAWPAVIARDDGAYRNRVATPHWQAGTSFPFAAAERILGLGDELDLRRTLVQVLAVRADQVRLDNLLETQGRRAEAENRLATLAGSADPRVASEASDILGVLAYGDLARGGFQSRPQAESSLADFQNAVRLDPANLAARFNLELALRLLLAHGERIGPGQGSGATTGQQGAAGGQAGRGY